MTPSIPTRRLAVRVFAGILCAVFTFWLLWPVLGAAPRASARPPALVQSITGLQYYPLPKPIRLFDTRAPIPGFAACEYLNQPLAADGELVKQARISCDGVTIPASAQAIVGNATVVTPAADGYVTIWPDGQARPPVSNLNYSTGQVVPNAFTVGLSGAGNFRIYSYAATHFIVDITGYFAPPGAGGLFYHPLPKPIRLFDTRAPIPGFAACEYLNQPLLADAELAKQARITCDGITIPPDASAIVGNATVIGLASPGFVTLWPNGQPRPPVSNLNHVAGQVVPNAFTTGLGADGQFRIYSYAQDHFIVDVTGYYSPSAADANGPGLLYQPLPNPIRLFDTRAPFPGFPACEYLNQPLAADAEFVKQARVTCNGVTIPATAQAITGNATVVAPAGLGFATLWPNGQMRPPVSNLNYLAGQVVPNAFTVGLGADGQFRIYTYAATHFITDVTGFYAPPSSNLPPVVNAGPDQTIAFPAVANLNGVVTDDGLPMGGALTSSWSKVSGPGTVTFGNANQAMTTATFSSSGVYVLRLTASDSVLTVSDDITINASAGLAVNAGADQVVTLPNTATLNGTITGGLPPIAIAWSKVSGPGTVIFSNAGSPVTMATIGINGVYVLRLSAADSLTTVTDDVQVTVNADPTPPPPDPMTVAPPINMTVATTVGAATQFLYTGANPIQTGVAPGTINPMRAAILKGRVLDKSNNPLSLVKITALDHPELGQTMSRADGRFDLAVNGGGVLKVKYEKVGFLPVQRTENVPWQDYCGVPDVVMMGYDANVTMIDLLASAPIQVAQSSISTDSSGTRRTALLFKQGTAATMKLPGGAMAGLDKLRVRATEFTAGTNGPNAMPGDLPANSAYTYAVEYSIDEAVAANAVETTFSQPVVQYNENFLNFPVGIDIPSGAYDRVTGQWVASASGRTVKILSITGGTANLDVNGAGVPATDPQYAALGINTAERQTLATLYAANQSLWRVPIIHFSPWDSNWPYGPPPDAGPPGGGPPSGGDDPPDDEDECPGCIIGVQGQSLGEELSLAGSPFKLRYSSDRKQGRVAARSLNIPLSGAAIPASLKRIELTVTVAGRTFTQSFPAQINQSTVFTWDGLDAYGRAMQGKQTATVTVGNVYDGSYLRTSQFGYNGNGVPITGDAARREITLAQVSQRELGAFDDRALALGGWSLDVHHFYDPTDRVIHEGNGARRTVQTINSTITTVAGNGVGGFTSDNVPATSTPFFFPFSATVAPNGELYVADFLNKRIRKVDLNGIVTTVVGTGANCTPTLPCGDGGQAVNAQLASATDVAFGPDGSLYIADAQAFRTRKVAPGGIITTVVGTGQACADPAGGCGDGGPATQAQLSSSAISCCTANLTVAPDGALYLGDAGNHRVRRVGTDGIITTIAGNGRTAAMGGCTVVGGSPVSATNACVSEPFDVTALADGSVYFTDAILNQIFRVTADGFIRLVAGDGVCGNTGDGGPALAARMCRPEGITRGPDGALYFSDWMNARIRRIDANGVITAYAATGVLGFSGDGGPALAAQIRQSIGLEHRSSIRFRADKSNVCNN